MLFILWDFAIQTHWANNRPEIVVKDYQRKTCLQIDMPVLIDNE